VLGTYYTILQDILTYFQDQGPLLIGHRQIQHIRNL